MASRSRSNNTRKTPPRAKKPTTIDLDAKEVGASATASNNKPVAQASVSSNTKTTATTAGQSSAKPGTSSAASEKTTTSANTKASGAATSSAKEPAKKPTETAPKSSDASNSTSPPPAPKQSKGGGLMGGLVGAAAAIAGLGAIGQVDGAAKLPLIGTLYSQEASVSQEPRAQATAQAEAIEQLKAEIAELKSGNENNTTETDGQTTARFTEIDTKIAELSETLGNISQTVQQIPETGGTETTTGSDSTELSASIATAIARLDALEGSIANLSSPEGTTPTPSDSGLLEKIASLEATLAGLSEASGENTQRIAAVSEQAASLKESVAAIPAPPETSNEELLEKITGLQTTLGALDETATNNAQQITAMGEQASSLQETVASVKASEKVAVSVSVNALGAALQNDDPATLAIASIKSLAGDSEDIARLEELAASGIPTRAQLSKELEAFTRTVQNPAADTQGTSLSDRFWANAQNLVSFRSTGPQEGDDPIAILSRVKATLEKGELTAAITEWETLPADVQQSGAGWLEKAKLRAEAFAVYERLSSSLSSEAG